MNKEQTITLYRYVNQRYALDRFEDAALDELLRYYNVAKKGALKDISRAIKRNYNHRSRARLTALLAEIDLRIETLTKKITKPVAEAVGEAGAYSYRNTNAILSWDGALDGFNNVALSAGQIEALVIGEKLVDKNLQGWLWDALTAENGALKAEIAAGRIRGVGYKKLLSELGSRYDNLLSSKGNEQNLETVVKSYIQSMNAKAHKDIYEANRDVIKGVEWSAIMENGNTKTGRGTCPRCMALDGMEYSSVAVGPSCPLHPRCRCMYLPVTKSWKELGFGNEEREGLNTKYKKWYERSPSRKRLAYGLSDEGYEWFWRHQPEKWQNNAIGLVRANLVREGLIPFQAIVYKNGNLIPVERMVKMKGVYKGVNDKTLSEAWPTRKGNRSREKTK